MNIGDNMKNNKGFSMVELLAVIVILGILFGIGMQAYSKYREKAKQQGYDTMAKSASHAAEEYKMEHPAATSIEFKKLKEENENLTKILTNFEKIKEHLQKN